MDCHALQALHSMYLALALAGLIFRKWLRGAHEEAVRMVRLDGTRYYAAQHRRQQTLCRKFALLAGEARRSSYQGEPAIAVVVSGLVAQNFPVHGAEREQHGRIRPHSFAIPTC